MVAGKVKQAMGLAGKPDKPKPKPNSNYKPPPPPPPPTTATKANQRTFGSYFPRASAQVQPSVSDLIQLVNDLKEREEYLKRELRETVSLKPTLSKLVSRVAELECDNHRLVEDRDQMKADIKERDGKIVALMAELEEVNKHLSSSHKFQGLVEVGNKSNLIKSMSSTRKFTTSTTHIDRDVSRINIVKPEDHPNNNNNNNNNDNNNNNENNNNVVELPTHRVGHPRVPKPPPRKCSSSSSSSHFVEPPPPPPLPAEVKKVPVAAPPPPPPPVARIGGKYMTAKVKRVPEVVEFYHSLMRRDTRREAGGGMAEVAAANSAKDLVGEIENRSAYLSAIKTDVETQGDFIRFLIKEVETAAFTDIDDVVSFVKWLDDELSYLVDERAVLKHFDWPEQKADGLREAAFEYSDLKKLESEASSFRHDPRQACSTTLKKMQTLLEKLEHGVYNLSRLKESATNRFKSFHIPVNWMLDAGFISQIKLASVKLAMKYMKRVLAELEIVVGGPEEEELIVQGVRFAFRVHQFAGGFDAETMTAFEELRDKARSFHVQCQNKQPQRLACQTMPY